MNQPSTNITAECKVTIADWRRSLTLRRTMLLYAATLMLWLAGSAQAASYGEITSIAFVIGGIFAFSVFMAGLAYGLNEVTRRKSRRNRKYTTGDIIARHPQWFVFGGWVLVWIGVIFILFWGIKWLI